MRMSADEWDHLAAICDRYYEATAWIETPRAAANETPARLAYLRARRAVAKKVNDARGGLSWYKREEQHV